MLPPCPPFLCSALMFAAAFAAFLVQLHNFYIVTDFPLQMEIPALSQVRWAVVLKSLAISSIFISWGRMPGNAGVCTAL